MNSINITGVILQTPKTSRKQIAYSPNQQLDTRNGTYSLTKSSLNQSKLLKPVQYPNSSIANRTPSPQKNQFLEQALSRTPQYHQRVKSEISQAKSSQSFVFEESNRTSRCFDNSIKIKDAMNESSNSHRQTQKSPSFVGKGESYKANNKITSIEEQKKVNISNSNNHSVYNMILNKEVKKSKSFFQQSKGSNFPTSSQAFQPISSNSVSSQNLAQYLNSSTQNSDNLYSQRNTMNKTQTQGNNFNQINNNNNCINNNINTQNTHPSVGSRCSNCIELEKELEMFRQIVKSCSKCSQTFLSTSRPNSGESQILEISNQNEYKMQQQYQQQFMQEKVVTMRLQEQIQQLRRQLDQMTIERDQLKYSKNTQSSELQEKLFKQDSEIQSLLISHSQLQKKVSDYQSLKMQVSDLLEYMKRKKIYGEKSIDQELQKEIEFLKQYLFSSQKELQDANFKGVSPSPQNIESSQFNIKPSALELLNQQLEQDKRQALKKYQTLPSSIKVLQIAYKLNPMLPNTK